VTNPDDVQNGANPVVQEVGPYVYEWVDQKQLFKSFKKNSLYKSPALILKILHFRLTEYISVYFVRY
jgi:hypothetical protein